MAAYVYILTHKDKPRFKIGKAIDVSARIGQLTHDELDLGRSYALEVEDSATAINLERALHRCFDKWRLFPADIVAQEGAPFTGYTEWFRIECFERLMNFIDHNAELFDYKPVTGSQLQSLVAKPAKLAKPTGEKPASHKVRTKSRITGEDISGAKEQTEQLLPTLLALLEHCDNAVSTQGPAGTRELSGICKPEHTETVEELLYELFDKGLCRHTLGGFGIFNSVRTQKDRNGGLTFSVSHIWDSTAHENCLPYLVACQTLVALPVPAAGWSH